MISRVVTTALAASLTAVLAAGSPTATAAGPAHTATPRTDLTLKVKGCEGCDLRLSQAVEGHDHVWQSRQRTVEDGTVSWSVPTARTHGLSITVLAPWDGGAGYVPAVAFRYAGEQVGDRVARSEAKSKTRASACWAGTRKDAASLAVTVVHARGTNPAGDPIRTPRAFTSVTQRWERPMERAWHGIVGTQDANWCG